MIACYLLAFVTAFYISQNDFFSKNPTILLAFSIRSGWFWVYGTIYGGLAILFLLFVQNKYLPADVVSNSGEPIKGFDHLCFYAIAAGIFIKSLMNITLINVPFEGKSFPIGFATIIQIVEPPIIRKLDDDHFVKFDKFLEKSMVAYQNSSVQEIHEIIRTSLSTRMSRKEVISFLVDLGNTVTVKEAFSLYLLTFGKKIFCHTFKVL